MGEHFKIEKPIGNNKHYFFAVAKNGENIFPVALGQEDNNLFYLPGSDRNFDLKKLTELVQAIALHPNHGYGGIDEYLISEDEKVKLEDVICRDCDEVKLICFCDDF